MVLMPSAAFALRFTGGQKVNLPGAKEVEEAGGKIWAGKAREGKVA